MTSSYPRMIPAKQHPPSAGFGNDTAGRSKGCLEAGADSLFPVIQRRPMVAPEQVARVARKETRMDGSNWASGRWQVQAGKHDEFVERWTTWLSPTSGNVPGFRSARLLRSDDDQSTF